jgi:hypothetical protein
MKHLLCSVFLGFAIALVLWAGASNGVVNRYVEDFTTTQYKDTLNTTAWWDTVAGELKLPPFELTLTGSYDTPGYAHGIALSGDYAYVADGFAGLQVIDITDTANPSLAGSYNTLDYAWGVAISGDYAYVADDEFGLQVIDISNPTNPLLAGNYDTPGNARSVAVSGDCAYVVDYTTGLQVIDISDPTNPSLAGSYDTPGFASGVAIAGDFVYVADYAYGLQVIDISDPTNPSLAGSYNTPSNARGVALSGDFAYVADHGSGLQVIDISDPTSPTLAGSYDTPNYAFGVAITGDFAYVADNTSGVHVIEINDPTNPLHAGSYDTPDNARGVTVSGDCAYVVDFASGLQLIKIGDSISPSLAGSYDTPSYAYGVAISGDYAYVADAYSGLQVIDISDPTSPSFAGSYSTSSSAQSVAISGDYAYVAIYPAAFKVIDISDPTSPTLAGSEGGASDSWGVAVSGDYAYVADDYFGLKVIDISDPTSPTLAGSYSTVVDEALSVAISGDYAYVANRSPGLLVIDISDPTSPTLAGSYDTPGDARHVAISGNYAYVADAYSGLQVIDISDPTNPSIAGSYDTPGAAYGVAISGDYACVADYSSGLQVIDISDPTIPTLAGSYNTPDDAYGIAVSGDCAYVADFTSGLQVIQISQRIVNPSKNAGQSLAFDSLEDDILWVRLASTQTDSISWEISADNGTNWQGILPDGAWNLTANPGSDLVWRSTHVYLEAQSAVNPTCTALEIEWLGSSGVIDSIVDVPNDQGKQTSITWTRSGYDYLGSPTPITEYAVYRKIDNGLSSIPVLETSEPGKKDIIHSDGLSASELAYPPGDWHFLMTLPACCEWSYAVVVPTLADSTVAEGMYYTTFFVRAFTETLGVYFDSPPDSGYSVDNLSPHIPESFAVAYNTGIGNELSWEACPDDDFQYFCVYREESEDFDPAPGNLVHTTTGTDWLDTVAEGWRCYYKITAVDFSGNESDPASAETATAIADPVVPERFRLYACIPNPFNPATVISYDVPPGGGRVSIRIYDVSGRLVRTLVDKEETAGRKTASWDGRDNRGKQAATGVYFYRMQAPGFEKTIKMTLLK